MGAWGWGAQDVVVNFAESTRVKAPDDAVDNGAIPVVVPEPSDEVRIARNAPLALAVVLKMTNLVVPDTARAMPPMCPHLAPPAPSYTHPLTRTRALCVAISTSCGLNAMPCMLVCAATAGTPAQVDPMNTPVLLYEAAFHPSVLKKLDDDKDYKEAIIELGLGCVSEPAPVYYYLCIAAVSRHVCCM